MAWIPSDAGRRRVAAYLSSLMETPPDGFEGLVIEKAQKNTARQLGEVTAEEIADSGEPLDLLDEHVEIHGHNGSGLRYRIRCRDAAGHIIPNGQTCAWGMKQVSGDAVAAKKAGGGSEVATAAMGRTQADGFAQMTQLVAGLAQQAAGTSGEQTATLLELQRDRNAEMMEMVIQNSTMQIALIDSKWEAQLAAQSSFFDSDAGAAFLASAAQGAVPLLSGAAQWLMTKAQTMGLENRREELRLRQLELELDERARAIYSAPPAPSGTTAAPGGKPGLDEGGPTADPPPGEDGGPGSGPPGSDPRG